MSQKTELFIDRNSGQLTLRSPAFGLDQPWNIARSLLSRLLAANQVTSVQLDRSRQTAIVQLIGDRSTKPVSQSSALLGLKELATQLRGKTTSEDALISDEYASFTQLRLEKTKAGMTAGTIVHSLPGRVRIRHPLLRQNTDLSRIERTLALVPGVKGVSTSSTTGSVLIQFDKLTTVANDLLMELERELTLRQDHVNLLKGPSTTRWVASGTCLGLAVASEFVAPGLAPVTAAALVGFNLPTMVQGITELCTLNWRVASLYTVIMGTTLLSGQFLAAALMQASITCWHGWSSRRLRLIAKRLQCEAELPILLDRSHQTILSNQERFPECLIGTELTVEPGMVLPYDGIVVAGDGELDERSVRGTSCIQQRVIGDLVFAGSLLLKGSLQVRITAIEKGTRVSKIRETLFESIAELPGSGSPTRRGHASASRFVPLTFATGTAALMVGDLTTLAAVLRPDFATGPSMSERFGTLTSISNLWDRGWLVKNTEALHELAQTETVVVFRSMEGKSQDESPLPHIQRREVSFAARTLNIYEIKSDEESCVEFVRQLRQEHLRVALVATGSVLNQLSEDDVIRISSTPDESLWGPSADLIALQSGPTQIEELWRILQEARRPHQQGWAAVMACNVLAISGAFLVGLTSLHVVVLTNLGALAAGALYDRHLRRSSLILSSSPQSDLDGDDGRSTIRRDQMSQLETPSVRIKPSLKPNRGSVGFNSFGESLTARMNERNSSKGRRWQQQKNIDRNPSTSAGQS